MLRNRRASISNPPRPRAMTTCHTKANRMVGTAADMELDKTAPGTVAAMVALGKLREVPQKCCAA